MSKELVTWLPLIICVAMFLLKFPIFSCLLVPPGVYFSFLNPTVVVGTVFQRATAQMESFTLLAIPFFILAGSIMNYSGITSRLMNLARMAVGRYTGGLAQVNVLLSALMGGVSGSAIADAGNECKILVPEMEKDGYPTAFSAAISAVSSIVTPIIPPGIGLIMYAFYANTSVADMFLAGYLPGVVIVICLMITVYIVCRKKGYGTKSARRYTLKEWIHAIVDSIWALFMPFGLILGMRIGLFTATEGGAMCVLYTTIVGLFIYKELKLSDFKVILKESFVSTASILIIVGCANAFGFYLSWEAIPQKLTVFLLSLTTNKYLMLLIFNIFLLIVGMFMEGNAATVIILPLLLPVLKQLDINLVQFGIIYSVNGLIGCCTPPFGTCMFTCCQITGTSIKDYTKAAMPLFAGALAALFIITYIPPVSLLLPTLFH